MEEDMIKKEYAVVVEDINLQQGGYDQGGYGGGYQYQQQE